jgi:very-short-patch-repair endonuclease
MFPYNPILEEQARYMKQNLSKADKILEALIKKNFPSIPFGIKIPVDDYIIDLLFEEKSLAIEIDSGQQENTDAYVYHAERKERLEALGLKLLRLEEKEILNNAEMVVLELKQELL